jgi:hypothetical protein
MKGWEVGLVLFVGEVFSKFFELEWWMIVFNSAALVFVWYLMEKIVGEKK